MIKTTIKSILVALLIGQFQYSTAQQVSSPKSHFGFNIGDDYMLANYKQMEGYFLKVAQESDRVLIRDGGLTEEGRKQHLIIISSPENLKEIEKYRKISQTLGRAEGITEEEARELAAVGKPVVWIDGGMHSNEMVGSHQLIETLYQLTNRNDAEIKNYLDKVVVLMWHVNPDGQDLLADWYMQYEDKAKRNMSIPTLYQKYVGHDNNRDFFMFNMKEASNLAKVVYIDWLPQIIYNHHQTSPDGTIVAGPPYRDPFNHVFDPLLVTGIDGVGFAMINRLNEEDKPGYVRMDQSGFSTWWNGGLRTAPYFHNMIGILTEVTGSPTPSNIPLVPERQVPRNGLPYPVAPQAWNFKKSIDYSVSMNFAILDYAARNGDKLLYNIYKMGKNSIDRGNKDHWTKYPKYAEQIEEKYNADLAAGTVKKEESNSFYRTRTIPKSYYDAIFTDKSKRDPRGYILSADQADFPTAIKFVNALIKSGVYVYQANSAFSVNNKQYPKGSIVVKTNQAFRPQVLDMFEPQDHPHDVEYEGGPPIRPYDAAGWTLAMQMGVDYDRVYEDINGPLNKIESGVLMSALPVEVQNSKGGYLINAKANDAFLAINQLLKSGVKVYRDLDSKDFYVDAKAASKVKEFGQTLGLKSQAIAKKPKQLKAVESLKIGLFDYYGGSMPSGWVRWILEQYGYDYDLFYPQDIDNNSVKDYDVLLFVGQGIPTYGSKATGRSVDADLVPSQYKHMLGSVTAEKSIPVLKSFVENGGQIVTIGASSELVYHFGLEVENPLVETNEDGKKVRLSNVKYYVPTSILRAEVDLTKPENYGLNQDLNIVFNNSPVFKFENSDRLYSLGSIKSDHSLLSGWAHGQEYLKDVNIGLVSKVGKGKLVAIGPEITNRAQSHGTFKMLFNQLYR
ncbi:M14 family metallopeptidase [Sphingobacterium cellulitidis]|uniref:M14 family metallopeptidase n=1 Tax=Sphingobacterium cellulitidis TaxID=1768011 RepID=UPI003C7C5A8C